MHQVIALCLSCRYFDDLLQLKGQSRRAGAEFLSWNDIQDSVNSTNLSVQEENDRESCPHKVWVCGGPADILGGRLHWDSSHNETPENLTPPWAVTPLGALEGLNCMSLPSHTGVHAVRLVNEALLQADPEKTLAALLLLAPALPDIALPTAPRYHSVLSRARRQKVQVGWGSSAVEYLHGSMVSPWMQGTPLWSQDCEVTPPHSSNAASAKQEVLKGGCPAH